MEVNTKPYDLWKEVEICHGKEFEEMTILDAEALESFYEQQARKAFDKAGLEVYDPSFRKIKFTKAIYDENGNIVDIVPATNFNALCRKKEEKKDGAQS